MIQRLDNPGERIWPDPTRARALLWILGILGLATLMTIAAIRTSTPTYTQSEKEFHYWNAVAVDGFSYYGLYETDQADYALTLARIDKYGDEHYLPDYDREAEFSDIASDAITYDMTLTESANTNHIPKYKSQCDRSWAFYNGTYEEK
jgi:hypothetical protein